MILWSTCFSMAVVAMFFALGNFISFKTRAYVSSVLVAVIVFVALMYTGIVPPDLCATAGLTGMVGTFVIPFCIIDVASKMKFKELASGWKTALTVVVAVIGIVAICVLVGIPLIGKAKALGAIGPLAGALLATTIAQQTAIANNAAEVGVFVMIVLVLQMLVALPIATICLKQFLKQIRSNGVLSGYIAESNGSAVSANKGEASKPAKRNIFATPKSLDCDFTIFFKIAMIGFIGYAVGVTLAGPTKNIINATLCYLVFGMIAAEIGFLERGPLEKAHSNGIIYFALFSLLLSTFASVSFEVMVAQILPAIGIILLAAVGMLVFTALFAKVIKVSPWLSMAVGMCCYLGYPCSQIVVEETVRAATDLTPEEAAACNSMIIPKMILGYFVAAIVSIISASIAVGFMF